MAGAWVQLKAPYADFLDLAFADNVQVLDLGEYQYDFRRWTQIRCDFVLKLTD